MRVTACFMRSRRVLDLPQPIEAYEKGLSNNNLTVTNAFQSSPVYSNINNGCIFSKSNGTSSTLSPSDQGTTHVMSKVTATSSNSIDQPYQNSIGLSSKELGIFYV